jgi:hypothetical protein
MLLPIYAEYNKNEMPSFLSFSDDDIKSIIAYIATGGPPPPTKDTPGPGGEPGKETPSFWLYIVLGVLVVIAFLLMRTNTILKRLAYEKVGQKLPDETPFFSRLKSRRAIALYGIIGVFVLGFYCNR